MNKHKASSDGTMEHGLLKGFSRLCRFDLYNRVMLVALLLLSGWSSARAQYGYVDGISALSANLTRGQTVSTTMRLQAGTEYFLHAVGAGGSCDVDLEVLSASGVVVASDLSYGESAMVIFKPTVSGQYTIRLKLVQGSGQIVCSLFINKVGGWEIHLRNMLTVFEKGMDTALVLRLTELATNTSIHFPVGSWFSYAGVLRVGEGYGMQNIYLPAGTYIFYSVSDNWALDTDLYVYRNGRLVDKDEDLDALPFVIVQSSGDYYEFKLTHAEGSGPSLAVVFVARIDKRL